MGISRFRCIISIACRTESILKRVRIAPSDLLYSLLFLDQNDLSQVMSTQKQNMAEHIRG